MNCLNTDKIESNEDTISTCLLWDEFVRKNEYKSSSISGIINSMSEIKYYYNYTTQLQIYDIKPFIWPINLTMLQGTSEGNMIGNQVCIHRIRIHVSILQFYNGGSYWFQQNRLTCWALRDTANTLVDYADDLGPTAVGVTGAGPQHRYHKLIDEHFTLGFPEIAGFSDYQKFFDIDIDYGVQGKVVTLPWINTPVLAVHNTKPSNYNNIRLTAYATIYYRDL